MGEPSFQQYLQNEFVLRCRRNPRYSIRAFARSLSVDHSTLSQILRGKRPLSKASVMKLGQALGMGSDQMQIYLKNLKPGLMRATYEGLAHDTFAVISDWYHYAIFELVTVKKFKQDFAWIAKALSISEVEAQEAVERLKRVGLLIENDKGVWRQSSTNITTVNNEFTALAFKNMQRGLLQLSLKALEEVPFEKRSHSAMTMAFNSKKLPEAKERIKKFRRELCEWLQKDPNRDAVYEMTVSLFPVTQIESETK